MTGGSDYILKVEVESARDFERIHKDILSDASGRGSHPFKFLHSRRAEEEGAEEELDEVLCCRHRSQDVFRRGPIFDRSASVR